MSKTIRSVPRTHSESHNQDTTPATLNEKKNHGHRVSRREFRLATQALRSPSRRIPHTLSEWDDEDYDLGY